VGSAVYSLTSQSDMHDILEICEANGTASILIDRGTYPS
jgi:hypothetical protein